MTTFNDLGLKESVLGALEALGFEYPTEIQAKTIVPALEGKDVIGKSATGSGKTLAFGAGLIHSLEKVDNISAVVLTPTRELAEQVAESLKSFAKYTYLEVVPIYGGVSINPQMEQLKTADIVVATPGRLLDHIGQGTCDLSYVKALVLDEADRMVDMGFVDDVNKIISYCPKEKQVLLFSATISNEINYIKKQHMKDPVTVEVESYVDPSKLQQGYYDVDDRKKFSLCVHLLKQEFTGLTIVFCNTKHQTDFVSKNLRYNGIEALGIHGGLTQAKRSQVMEKFSNNKVDVLVCTDVAARGLDIPGVTQVFNYDLPNDARDYIHRIGRTARAGKDGKVVNLLGGRDHQNFGAIEGKYRELKIPKLPTPKFERAHIKASTKHQGRGGRGGFNRNSGPRSGSRHHGPRGGHGGNRGRGSRGPGQSGPRRGPNNQRNNSGERSF